MTKPTLPASHHASPLFKWDDGDPEVNFRSAREQASANDDFDDIKSFPLASRLIALIWIASIAIVGSGAVRRVPRNPRSIMNTDHMLEPMAADVPPTEQHRPLTVIEHAIRSGASADQLERMLELQVRADNHKLDLMREQRKMQAEDRAAAAKLAFDAALTKFRHANIIVPKTKQVSQIARSGGQGPTFKQSEFDVVCSMISVALADAGLTFRHDMRFGTRKWTTDGVESDVVWVYVTCFLTHVDGHSEQLDLEGPPDSSGSKNPLQEMQSTASYLKRQSLLAITGTATGGEDDENRMRGKFKPREPDAVENDPEDTVLQAGRDAALGGTASVNAWWGSLTAQQRGRYSKEFAGMRKAAQQADRKTVAPDRAHVQSHDEFVRAMEGNP